MRRPPRPHPDGLGVVPGFSVRYSSPAARRAELHARTVNLNRYELVHLDLATVRRGRMFLSELVLRMDHWTQMAMP
jgi:hypothetical protein